ncbi:MAG: hypothetical protein PHN89_00490 [Candidatus Pacebacteria bacterium]|nr:hypothetical protein [Candidatus Paceibacterota bacterium]
MNYKPKFFGSIWKGDVVHNDPEKIKKYLSQFEDGQEVEITIGKKRKVRTSGQPGELTNFNGYYWGVIVRMIADEMGEIDQDYVHGVIQIAAGNFKISKYGDKIPKGTKNMTGAEFSDYCSRCRIWASKELGLSIPEPNEVEWENHE